MNSRENLLRRIAAELVTHAPLSSDRIARMVSASPRDVRVVLLGMRDIGLVRLKAGTTTVLYEATAELRERVQAGGAS